MLSVIILTLDSIKFIKPCLDSIFSQGQQGLEAIVVDNASEDGTTGFIKENYPQVILIENKKNFGAAKARNQGIEVASGEWILTLDCDIVLENNFLGQIMQFAGNLEDPVGMVQPKILNIDKKTVYSCGIYLSRLRRFYDINKGRIDNGQFNAPQYIFGACSAAVLYKRRMLEEIREDTGYFDERFFFLVEDVDLAWRAQKRGWKVLFYPAAICYHAGNSSNISLQKRQYFCFRNRYYMLLKNQNLCLKAIHFFLSLPYDSARLLYFLIKNKYSLKAIREIAQFL